MSLNASVSLNYASYSAGQTPPPQATVTVFNPNASPVLVTGVQMTAVQLGNTQQSLALAQTLPATGPGQTMLVPAGGSITIGPMAIALGFVAYVAGNSPALQTPSSAANSNSPQNAVDANFTAMIGATLTASDASVNVAVPAPLLVYGTLGPTLGSQGGFANFSSPQNASALLPMGVL